MWQRQPLKAQQMTNQYIWDHKVRTMMLEELVRQRKMKPFQLVQNQEESKR
jgi:hypothetical protein